MTLSMTRLVALLIVLFALPTHTFADEALTTAEYVTQGLKYETGDTVIKDLGKAAEYYRLAAEAGSHQGMHNLGSLYNTGSGVEKNRQKAIEWWRKASQLGNRFSSFNLANAHHLGFGVEENRASALNLYFLSYQQGYLPAICKYASVSYSSDAVFNLRQFQTLLKEAASIERTLACMSDFAGILYENDELIQETELMLKWAKKAGEENSPEALFLLGLIYDYGTRNIEKAPFKAKDYYIKAAQHGAENGYSNLGFMYEQGDFGAPDYVLARQYYEKSIEMGSVWGLNNLATFYRSGKTKINDPEKAFVLYKQAAAQDNAYAYRNLGNMYHNGQGVEKDAFQAKLHLEKAVALGYQFAMVDLALLYADETLQTYEPLLAQQLLIEASAKEVPTAAAQLAFLYTGDKREFYAEHSTDPEVAFDLASYFRDTAEDQEKACVWFYEAFERRQDDAYIPLIVCLESGINPGVKYKNAEEIVRAWAEFKEWDAESLLGELYYYGEGFSQDLLKAAYYFEFSVATTKDSIALNKLGDMYRTGEGVSQNFKKAYGFYKQAGDEGLSLGFYHIGMMYKLAQGVPLNENLAFSYMKRAAEFKDSGGAMFEYAKMLNTGYAGVQDISESHDWFDRAVQAHNEEALCELGKSLTTNAATDEELLRGKQIMQRCQEKA